MPYPNLIGAVTVKIRQLDQSLAIVDDEARTLSLGSTKSSTVVTVTAQVRRLMDPRRDQMRGGARYVAKGYFVKRTDDGVDTLKDLDKIVEIAGDECEYYLLDKEPMAHHTDIGRAGAHKWWYGSKEPVNG